MAVMGDSKLSTGSGLAASPSLAGTAGPPQRAGSPLARLPRRWALARTRRRGGGENGLVVAVPVLSVAVVVAVRVILFALVVVLDGHGP